jgi:hypothetical protein
MGHALVSGGFAYFAHLGNLEQTQEKEARLWVTTGTNRLLSEIMPGE